MKIAFVAICAQGHLNSTTPLARKLKARGHDVVLISLPDAEPFAKAADLPFVPYCGDEYPPGALRALFDQLGKLQGEEAFKFTFQALAQASQISLRHLPRTLKEAGVDAVVLDESQASLALAAMHLGMPYVHFSSAIAFDFSGKAPLCFYDWPHETTPEALVRNQEGVRKTMEIFELSHSTAREYAERNGLKIDWTDPFALISKLAWLTQTPKEFDFPSAHMPKQFHYTGPFHDGVGRIPTEFPWERLTGEPLIYASMGTLQNGLEPVFNTIVEAVGKSAPDMQLVLSIGPVIDAKRLQSLPPNAIVMSSTPQQEILERASLCITHAGLNTTLESLMHGVPMVAIPVTNDQPGVAARIAYTKTGKFVPVQQLTTNRLSSLISDVLRNPEYRQNALAMKRAIAKTDGLEKAADLIEQAFGLSRKQKEEVVLAAR